MYDATAPGQPIKTWYCKHPSERAHKMADCRTKPRKRRQPPSQFESFLPANLKSAARDHNLHTLQSILKPCIPPPTSSSVFLRRASNVGWMSKEAILECSFVTSLMTATVTSGASRHPFEVRPDVSGLSYMYRCIECKIVNAVLHQLQVHLYQDHKWSSSE